MTDEVDRYRNISFYISFCSYYSRCRTKYISMLIIGLCNRLSAWHCVPQYHRQYNEYAVGWTTEHLCKVFLISNVHISSGCYPSSHSVYTQAVSLVVGQLSCEAGHFTFLLIALIYCMIYIT